MKSFKISIGIFLVMVIIMIVGNVYIHKVYTSLKNEFNNIEIHMENNNWDITYNEVIEILDSWSKYSKTLTILIHHEEIDLITNELYKLSQYTKENNKDESLASLHLIKILLENIIEGQKINFQNILKI